MLYAVKMLTVLHAAFSDARAERAQHVYISTSMFEKNYSKWGGKDCMEGSFSEVDSTEKIFCPGATQELKSLKKKQKLFYKRSEVIFFHYYLFAQKKKYFWPPTTWGWEINES